MTLKLGRKCGNALRYTVVTLFKMEFIVGIFPVIAIYVAVQ